MGIMNVIRKMSEKKAISKEKLKNAQEDMKIQKILEERAMSSNQRELERYMKDQEELRIKQTLEKIRKKEQTDLWSGKNSLMNQKMNILKEDRPILMEKNIFSNNKKISKGSMFFKW